jgi:integrase
MPKRAPKYSLHKPSGRARVRIKGKDIYLGDYNSRESLERYNEIVAKWLTGKCDIDREALTLSRLAIMYVDFARGYYRKDGSETAEVYCIQMALKPLIRMHGRENVGNFGPRKLKAVRDEMIRLNWARTTINASVQRINRMFRWAAENEYADAAVYQSCRSMTGLRRGRCNARETKPVQPAPQCDIDAIELYVSRQIWSMIQLQLVTGMRPGEVCMIRGCDLDQSGPVWEYRPQTHKTEHHGRQRLIFIGPRGQAILKPYLDLYPDGSLFRPDDSERARNSLRKSGRKTPMTPGHANRTRKEDPQRTPGERYQRTSYTRAISRACRLAKVPEWSPNQLRHNAATELRKQFGLEATRTVLGHSNADMTQVYAELDFDVARKIMLSSG